jgi:hypothetical protein
MTASIKSIQAVLSLQNTVNLILYIVLIKPSHIMQHLLKKYVSSCSVHESHNVNTNPNQTLMKRLQTQLNRSKRKEMA